MHMAQERTQHLNATFKRNILHLRCCERAGHVALKWCVRLRLCPNVNSCPSLRKIIHFRQTLYLFRLSFWVCVWYPLNKLSIESHKTPWIYKSMTILVCKSQVQIISESCKADLTNFSDNCLDKVLLHSNLVKIAKQWIFSRKSELGSEHKRWI